MSPYDFYRYVYPFPEEVLAHLAYFFEDLNYAAEYMEKMVLWRDRLVKGVSRWSERFNGSDGHPRAILALKPADRGAVVIDTRSGELVRHEMDDLEHRILTAADSSGQDRPPAQPRPVVRGRGAPDERRDAAGRRSGRFLPARRDAQVAADSRRRRSMRIQLKPRAALHHVRVTLLKPRGASVSRPMARAR